MASQRVIAFFMHEHEADAARPIMQGAQETESFMVGEVDEAGLQRLRAAGCIVQKLEEVQRPPLMESLPAEVSTAALRVGGRPLPEAAPVGFALDPARPGYYRLTVHGPLLEQWRLELGNHGVKIVDSLPGFAMTARIDAEQVAAVANLPFVRSVVMHEGSESRPREGEMAVLRESERTGVRAMITYDVLLREEDASPDVQQWLVDRNVEIAAAGGNKIRIYLPEDSPVLGDLADTPEIDRVEPYIAPKLHNDQARVLLRIQQATPGTELAQQGDGQIVAVADTGLDETHPDIPKTRIAGIVALGRPGNPSDPNGHGTHVAGSVLGDGASSAGQFRGTAPKAKLFFQSLLDPRGELGGLPFRLQDLFDEAYRAGARIHNNSWGAATASSYRVSSSEVDDFVQNKKDMLIVISAGNEGTAADPASGKRNAQPGCVEWLSVGSPATSKNALTVGASQSNRTSGGLSALKYGDAWPQEFGTSPVKDELISGSPDSLAAFSSRGPCDDYRIKPDVVAPGTDIVSCKSRTAPARNFWGLHSNSDYAYMGGTSMAAPLVAGCAALIREYYVDERDTEPSAALIRATVINGTRWLSGPTAIADHPNTPNYHQGFGCVDMSRTIPNPIQPGMKLEFFDNWKEASSYLSATGQRRRFQVTVAAGQPLRVCLAYTDPPGRALQNNLNLLLEDPTGKKWMGNEQVPMALNIPDPTNNVEIVRIDSPPAGIYLIQITATNLLRPPQDFALVVTGDITGFVRVT